MIVIDGHAHIFENLKGFSSRGELRAIGGGRARWATGEEVAMIPPEYGSTKFTGEDLIRLMDENKVDMAILLQGSYYGFQNEYVTEIVKKYPNRFRGAGVFDPFCRYADKIFERLRNELKFRIWKIESSSVNGLLGYHRSYRIDQVFAPYLSVIASDGGTVAFDIGDLEMDSYQIEAMRSIAQQYPELKIVICHLLSPNRITGERLKKDLEKLALSNVWFDLAALPYFQMPERWPFRSAQNFIECAIEIVGHKKLIQGTDIPSVLIYEKYGDLMNYIREIPGLTEKEKEDILGNNAIDAYSIKMMKDENSEN